jgi:protein-L-isoaspartate(D-aspartate) O-methyltransferase
MVGVRICGIEGQGNAMHAKLITRISEHKWETKSLFETHLDVMQGLETTESFKF